MTGNEKVKPEEKPEDKQDEGSSSSAVPLLSAVKPHPEPTRYGDWEIKGKCVDF